MPEVLKLNPYQQLFVDAREQYVGLFGGVGNGKTLGASLKMIELMTNEPNNLGLIGRLTYPELRDSTRESFLGVLTKLYPKNAYVFNKAENSLTFWNNSTIIFRHLDNPANLLSLNLGAFYIDQAEEVDEDAFLTLQSRLRRQNIKNIKGLITGNPCGYNWVYYKFGLDKYPGQYDVVHNQYYRMISAPTIANASNLPVNYIDQLKNSYSPEWFNRYVMGDWGAFEGQIFNVAQIKPMPATLPRMKGIFTACDPAISKDDDACNTAFCTLGVGVDGHVYDLETIAGRWSFLETLDIASALLKRQRSQYLGVENVGYQRALAEACRKYFPDVMVIDLKADKDKFRRARAVSHIIQKGLFHTEDKDLISELTAFDPDGKGKAKKDRVDAMVHALGMVQKYAPIEIELPVNEFKGMTEAERFRILARREVFRGLAGEGHERVFNGAQYGIIDEECY